MGLKAIIHQYKLITDRNTRDNLAQTIVNRDPMHCMYCVSHMVTARAK